MLNRVFDLSTLYEAYFQTGLSYPGPADYLPKVELTKSAAPHYSIVGRPKIIDGKHSNDLCRDVARRRPGSTGFNIFPSVLKLNG